jgi:hypothetical protein
MEIAMQPGEVALLRAFLERSKRYLEFGAGGSTYLAAGTAKDWIISVDSSREWLDKVAESVPGRGRLTLVHFDIGRLGDWGFPADDSVRDRWPLYHEMIWHKDPRAAQADVCLVDGRFRVSCAVRSLLFCRRDAVVLMHDFTSRPQYHVVRSIAREIACCGDLSAFVRSDDFTEAKALDILKDYRFDPA